MRKTLKKPLALLLLILFIWGVYLAQISPEAEQYFYGGSEQERQDIEEKVQASFDKKLPKIDFVGDIDRLYCPLTTSRVEVEPHFCATKKELQQIIVQNQNLLDSYQQDILNYEHRFTGQTTITASRLLKVKAHLMSLEGQSSEALTLLGQAHSYWKRTLLDQNKMTSWIYFAVTQMNNTLILDAIESILSTNTQFTSEEYGKLYKELEPFHFEKKQIETVFKYEFERLKLILPHLQRKNHPVKNLFLGALLNRHYEKSKKLMKATSLSLEEYCALKPENIIKDSDKSKLSNLLYYGPYGLHIETFHIARVGIMLINPFKSKNSHRQFLRFIIKLKDNKIPSTEVMNFINNNQGIATNPLTGELFSYDEKSKILTLGQMECSPDYIHSAPYSGEY